MSGATRDEEANGPLTSWLSETAGVSGDRFLKCLRRHSSDLIAGLTGGLAGVPDGMADSVIIGVPPVHGLYASAFGRIIGGLTSSSGKLVITTTSASALAVLETIRNVEPEDRIAALLLLTLLAGLFQIAGVFLGLIRLTSFVSHSVMTGFLMGIAALIILGQMGAFVGYEPEGSTSLAKAADVLRHLGQIDVATFCIGGLTVALLIGCKLAGVASFGPIVALAVPSLVVAVAGISGILTVGDSGAIPSDLPPAALPDFSLLDLPLVTGALALAAIILVQTAGVSQGLPNVSMAGVPRRDVFASGLANVGTACFSGQPVGGSLSQSAINVESGAKTRLASISSGLWLLLALLLFSALVERVVMAALAGILIVSAWGVLNLRDAAAIWQTNWTSRASILVTFVLTLLLPIQLAVLGGVLLSALLHLATASTDVRLAELVIESNGELREQKPPRHLASDSAIILQVYGNLFYAGARTLARRLPDTGDARRVVVILRLRGKTRVGATAVEVLAAYAKALKEQHGRLYIAGLTPELRDQMKRSGKLLLAGVRLFPASHIQGRSVSRSYRSANTWLIHAKEAEAAPNS